MVRRASENSWRSIHLDHHTGACDRDGCFRPADLLSEILVVDHSKKVSLGDRITSLHADFLQPTADARHDIDSSVGLQFTDGFQFGIEQSRLRSCRFHQHGRTLAHHPRPGAGGSRICRAQLLIKSKAD